MMGISECLIRHPLLHEFISLSLRMGYDSLAYEKIAGIFSRSEYQKYDARHEAGKSLPY